MNAETIATCPFCGGDPAIIHNTVDFKAVSHAITCFGCEAGTKFYTDEADAIAAWNRRADLDATPAAPVPVPEDVLDAIGTVLYALELVVWHEPDGPSPKEINATKVVRTWLYGKPKEADA